MLKEVNQHGTPAFKMLLIIPMWTIIGIGEWRGLQFMGLGPWLQVVVPLSWRPRTTAIGKDATTELVTIVSDGFGVPRSLTLTQGTWCRKLIHPNQRDGDWILDYVEGANVDFAPISFLFDIIGLEKSTASGTEDVFVDSDLTVWGTRNISPDKQVPPNAELYKGQCTVTNCDTCTSAEQHVCS